MDRDTGGESGHLLKMIQRPREVLIFLFTAMSSSQFVVTYMLLFDVVILRPGSFRTSKQKHFLVADSVLNRHDVKWRELEPCG